MIPLQLGWKFYDGDDYHPEENKQKMAKGIPLNDQVLHPSENSEVTEIFEILNTDIAYWVGR